MIPSIAVFVMSVGGPLFAENGNELKVSKVALFSSGVGYFDCSAQMSGIATGELRFRTDQMNDVLKSLVVQDLGGGTVSVVSYPSKDPIEKTLKSFGVDITGKPSLGQLFDQLRGEPVQIAGPKAMSGTIIGVELGKHFVEGDKFIEVDVLNLLTDGGIQQLRISDLQGIKLTNEKVDGELRKALVTLASSHDADKKSLELRFDGQGTREVHAAYLVEAPIWKTTYRLVLTDKDKATLQGWAMVENATEEDWKDVRLSLISGRPISFTMDLYTPLYVPRPREQLELYASLRAPEMEGGFVADMDAPAAIAHLDQPLTLGVDSLAGNESAGRLLRRDQMSNAARARAQDIPGSFAGTPASPYDIKIPKGQYAEVMSRLPSVADADEAGELFEYQIKTPVSIPRRQSAMLPIVSESVSVERLSVYNQTVHSKHPLNTLNMSNATSLHLMQGPVTVFDGNLYAGDAKLPDLKPAEKRMVAYALDLGTEVNTEAKSKPDEIVSIRIVKGVLYHAHRGVNETSYIVKNKDDEQRTVIVEHPIYSDWKLLEPKEPFEKTSNLWRFKVSVAGKKSETLTVKTERVYEQSVGVRDCAMDHLQFYMTTGAISKKAREALERYVVLKTELDRVSRELTMARRDLTVAKEDQGRVRQNVQTFEKNSDTYAKQVQKFNELETLIEETTKKVTRLEGEEEGKRRGIEDYVAGLDVE